MCLSLFFIKIAVLRSKTLFKKRLQQHRCFVVNFFNFHLRTVFLLSTSGWLFLPINNIAGFLFSLGYNHWAYNYTIISCIWNNLCIWSDHFVFLESSTTKSLAAVIFWVSQSYDDSVCLAKCPNDSWTIESRGLHETYLSWTKENISCC